MELEKRGKEYFWNPVYGNFYCIGFQHDPCIDTRCLTYAFYIGIQEDGKRVLARLFENGEIRIYESAAKEPSGWHSDGEDEPSFPHFRAIWTGGSEPAPDDYRPYDELTSAQREYLRAVLDRMEKADKTPLSD